jgi:hypothetical protein
MEHWPLLDEVEARMAPGEFSREGFLGPGERLEVVLREDAELVVRLGLSHAELAGPLDELLTAAKASRLRRARRGIVMVSVEVFRGFQLCPWSPQPPKQCRAGSGVTHASLDWHLRSLRTGAAANGPGLAVHLIRDHGFYGGHSSPRRVDPLALARALDIPAATP